MCRFGVLHKITSYNAMSQLALYEHFECGWKLLSSEKEKGEILVLDTMGSHFKGLIILDPRMYVNMICATTFVK